MRWKVIDKYKRAYEGPSVARGKTTLSSHCDCPRFVLADESPPRVLVVNHANNTPGNSPELAWKPSRT